MRCSELKTQLEDLNERVYREMPQTLTNAADSQQRAKQLLDDMQQKNDLLVVETKDSLRNVDERLAQLNKELELQKKEAEEKR